MQAGQRADAGAGALGERGESVGAELRVRRRQLDRLDQLAGIVRAPVLRPVPISHRAGDAEDHRHHRGNRELAVLVPQPLVLVAA
jgi:hypothetical protein